VKLAVMAEARNRPKCRAAVYAELASLLQQPFVDEMVLVPMLLLHVEP
jgi:hypothetical protein